MLESKRVIVVRLATVTVAVVALVAAWHATSGIRSSAAADAIFVVGATVAVIAAASTIVTAAAVAAAAPLVARRPTAVHAYPHEVPWGWKRGAFRQAFHVTGAAYKPGADAHN